MRDSYKNVSRAVAADDRKSLAKVTQWRDFHSSADPVSGGASIEDHYDNVQTFAVRNRNSVWRDHSEYLSNDVEYWPRVVALLLAQLPDPEWALERERLEDLTERLAERHQRQGRWQVGARWVAVAVAACAAYAAAAATPVLPQEWARSAGAWLQENSLGFAAGAAQDLLQRGSTPALAALVGAVSTLVALTGARRLWQAVEFSAVEEGQLPDERGMCWVLAVVVIFLGAGVAMVGRHSVRWGVDFLVAVVGYGVFVGLIVVVVGRTGVRLPGARRRLGQERLVAMFVGASVASTTQVVADTDSVSYCTLLIAAGVGLATVSYVSLPRWLPARFAPKNMSETPPEPPGLHYLVLGCAVAIGFVVGALLLPALLVVLGMFIVPAALILLLNTREAVGRDEPAWLRGAWVVLARGFHADWGDTGCESAKVPAL